MSVSATSGSDTGGVVLVDVVVDVDCDVFSVAPWLETCGVTAGEIVTGDVTGVSAGPGWGAGFVGGVITISEIWFAGVVFEGEVFEGEVFAASGADEPPPPPPLQAEKPSMANTMVSATQVLDTKWL